MKKINIVFKMMLPLLIGLFLIASISIYSNFFFLEKNIVKKSNETFDSISKLLKNIIQQDTNLMVGFIEQLEQDKTVIDLYQKRDREKLFSHLEKTFKSYQNRYDITHFYIHDLKKENFLRVHNKNTHSDKIVRETLQNAAITLQPSSGIEFGVAHNLTLRVVVPWFVDNKHIGYIELGKEIDKLTPQLTNYANADFIFSIKKNLLSKVDFKKLKNKSYKNTYYNQMNNFYIIDSTIANIGLDLRNHLDKMGHVENNYLENEEKKYFINTRPFYDIKNQKVGNIHILVDVTQDYSFVYLLIIKVSFIVFILLFFMLTYYLRFLKKQESKLKNAYLKIHKLSITDGLTNLYNKRYYLEHAPKQMNICSRCNGYISFILIDVDNFKKYNDIYGHLKGDKVLKKISKIMNKVFKRSSDYSYRVGGEEFLIVSESQDERNSLLMVEDLRKEVEMLNIEHKENENYGVLTVSIGVCTQQVTNITTIDKLFSKADKALYKSKNNGRNKVTLY